MTRCCRALRVIVLAVWVCSAFKLAISQNAASSTVCTLEETRVVDRPAAGKPEIQDRPIYFDNDGLIVHRDPDGRCNGGDTAQREGWYWVGVWIREHTPGLSPWPIHRRLTFDQVLALLEPHHDGVFYRHPTLAPWNHPYDKEWGTSRDQLVPLIAAMGLWGKTAALERLWDALPEDLQGKHAFNGNWRNLLGQDGWNCSDIKSLSCGGTLDCSLREDTRDCSPQIDNRDCSPGEDKRDCSQPHDERGCNRQVCLAPVPFTGGCAARLHQ
jgi:hypothetical protein